MKRSILVNLCAVMLLTFGAIRIGNALGGWIFDRQTREYRELVERQERELEAFGRSQAAELRRKEREAAETAEGARKLVELLKRERDAEVERLRREHEEQMGL